MRFTATESALLAFIGAFVVLSSNQDGRSRSGCRLVERYASAQQVEELALKRRARLREKKTVCFFDLDDTLVDTSTVVGRYRNMALYKGIPHMIALFHALQQHSHMVILTARPPGGEVLAIKNCAHVGIKLRARDEVVICPADQKAAWREAYCNQHRMRALVLAGDRHTDVNGPAGAIALRVHPGRVKNQVCGDCTLVEPN